MPYVPICEFGFEQAKEKGADALDLYKRSYKANLECAKAIDNAIKENFDGMHLNDNTAESVIKEYGIDRVCFVLANTLKEKDYDGRFSVTNKEWSKTVNVPDNYRNNENLNIGFELNAHPAVLDGFCDMVRKSCEELKKPSIRKQLNTFSEKQHQRPQTEPVRTDKGAR